jgi:CheY-like chemotaxis protein
MTDNGQIKILVVDDEKVIRDFLSRYFTSLGLQSLAVDNGCMAIEAARKERFDLVFLDIRMPRMNGIQALQELMKIDPDSNYVMMTGYAVEEVLEDIQKYACVGLIRKPFETEELLLRINEVRKKKSG